MPVPKVNLKVFNIFFREVAKLFNWQTINVRSSVILSEPREFEPRDFWAKGF
jgi:hypothetical protein